MKRVGGFDRSALVIVTPTGTGWVDEQAIDPIEFLHGGDIASVGAQYSYLASWMSLLVEPGYGAEQSRALFSEIYGSLAHASARTRGRNSISSASASAP